MDFYIKEWPDQTASLMTTAGQRLFDFKSVGSALEACGNCYGISKHKVIPALTIDTNHRPSSARMVSVNIA